MFFRYKGLIESIYTSIQQVQDRFLFPDFFMTGLESSLFIEKETLFFQKFLEEK